MKYLFLFGGTAEYMNGFTTRSPEEQQRGLEAVNHWMDVNASKIRSRNRLLPPDTATTVRFGDGGTGAPVVKDGPFLEGKELLGGYCEVEVADLDEALELAKTWPAMGVIEIRPIMEAPQPVA